MSSRSLSRRNWVAATAIAISSACSAKDKPRGELVVIVSADVSIPKDINQVVLQVLNDSGSQQSLTYVLLPDDLGKAMPGSISIVPPDSGGQHVRVRLIAERDPGTGADPLPRVLREATVNVPTDRSVMLPMPLRWLCDGHETVTPDKHVQSDCPQDETCAAGKCVSAVHDAAKLPDYDPRKVFGGGDENGVGGQCINVQKCFANSVPVVPDEGCTLSVPTGASLTSLNIAMLPNNGDGVCTGGNPRRCFVPLDHDPSEGWDVQDGRIVLPEAVCTELAPGGKIASLALTTACPTKDGTVPICGPWTNVTAEEPVSDVSGAGGAPDNNGGAAGATESAAGESGAPAAISVAQELPVTPILPKATNGTTYIPGGSVVLGPDGNLWFIDSSGMTGNVGRLSTDGSASLFPVPYTSVGHVAGTGDALVGITLGGDGNLWFLRADGGQKTGTGYVVESASYYVGHVTPDGDVTTGATSVGTDAGGIVWGPDGNLWVTSGAGVVRITPDGKTNDSFGPAAAPLDSKLMHITVGPDQNLWFTDWGASYIGSVTPAGVVTEFSVSTPLSHPFDIVTGPDHNLWFTETAANNIGRMTPAGVVTEFALPTKNSGPTAIIVGPDHNLWFTETATNQIGRITTKGVVTEYALPASTSGPQAIVVGPDQKLWFSGPAGFGKFDLP